MTDASLPTVGENPPEGFAGDRKTPVTVPLTERPVHESLEKPGVYPLKEEVDDTITELCVEPAAGQGSRTCSGLEKEHAVGASFRAIRDDQPTQLAADAETKNRGPCRKPELDTRTSLEETFRAYLEETGGKKRQTTANGAEKDEPEKFSESLLSVVRGFDGDQTLAFRAETISSIRRIKRAGHVQNTGNLQ